MDGKLKQKKYKLEDIFLIMFRVFTTKEFQNNFDSLDGSEKKRVSKILNQLKEKGRDVGKPLKVPYFREKRFDEKRLYFLAYEKSFIILAIAISDKKTQQETINKIISDIESYKKFIDKKLKELGL